MLHLLPEQQKKAVLSEYRKRLGIVSSLFIIFLSVTGSILMLPSYIYSQTRYSDVKQAKRTTDQKLAEQQGDKVAEIVKAITDNIDALQPLGASDLPSDVFKRLVANIQSGIGLTHITYKVETDGKINLQIIGKATARKDLTEFIRTLQADKYFEGAKLPLSNFTRERDIDFMFTVKVKGISNNSTSQ